MSLEPNLLRRLEIFLYDLQSYKHEERFDHFSLDYPQYHLSTYYFTESEISYLLNKQNDEELSLKELIDQLFLIRSHALCTSHDLFPLLVKFFNLKLGKKLKSQSQKFKGLINL